MCQNVERGARRISLLFICGCYFFIWALMGVLDFRFDFKRYRPPIIFPPIFYQILNQGEAFIKYPTFLLSPLSRGL